MPSQKPETILSGELLLRRSHVEPDSFLTDPDVATTPVIARPEANPDTGRLGTAHDCWSPFAIAIQEELPCCRQDLCQSPFLLLDSGEVAEKLQMLAPNVGQQAMTGLHQPEERKEFTGVIGAHLQDRGAV